MPETKASDISPTKIPKKKLNKKVIILIAAGVTLLVAGGVATSFVMRRDSNGYNTIYNYNTNPTNTTTPTSQSCSLAKVDYPESAFSIGVPDGWIHEVSGDTISIMEDDKNVTAAFIYTAKLEKDLSASDFLKAFGNVFKATIENAGGSFALTQAKEANNIATAEVTATVSEGDLKGVFMVEKAKGFVTLKAYWAPKAELASKETELKQVVGCFSRETLLTDKITSASAKAKASETPTLVPKQGQFFKYSMPESWNVTGETDSGIDMEAPNKEAAVSFAYATGAQGPIQNRAWAEKVMNQLGISASLGTAQTLPGVNENNPVEAYDFSGTFSGKSVKGKITVGVYNIPSIFSTYSSVATGIQIANADLWDSLKTTTQAIQDSVLITDIGSRKNIQLPQNHPIDDVGGSSITASNEYKNQVQDEAASNWSDAMREYTTVESPSTGQHYDAPLNSWDATGADGPGWYRELPGGGTEKLNPVE